MTESSDDAASSAEARPLLSPCYMARVHAAAEAAYVAELDVYYKELSESVADRGFRVAHCPDVPCPGHFAPKLAPNTDGNGPTTAVVSATAARSPALAAALTAHDLATLAKTLLVTRCDCFFPADGEPLCAHAEEYFLLVDCARDTGALVKAEDEAWRIDVLAAERAAARELQKHGSVEEQWRRAWTADQTRFVVDTLHREDVSGRQFVHVA